ncbi:MAG: hypothetical protein WCG26_10600 [Chloroflexales bacterium]
MAGNSGYWFKTGKGSVKGVQYVPKATLAALGLTAVQAHAGLAAGHTGLSATLSASAQTPAGVAQTKVVTVAALITQARAQYPHLTITRSVGGVFSPIIVEGPHFSAFASAQDLHASGMPDDIVKAEKHLATVLAQAPLGPAAVAAASAHGSPREVSVNGGSPMTVTFHGLPGQPKTDKTFYLQKDTTTENISSQIAALIAAVPGLKKQPAGTHPKKEPAIPKPPTLPKQPATKVGTGDPVSASIGEMPSAASHTGKTALAVLAAIDKVHSDGQLPKITIIPSASENTYGCYYPGKLEMKLSSKSSHPLNTLAHEMGHFLDNRGLPSNPSGVTWSSEQSKRLAGFRVAVAQSEAIQRISKFLTNPVDDAGFTHSQKHVVYLMTRKEIFARDYAQYIAVKSGDPAMLAELKTMQEKAKKPGRLPNVWSDEDFAPIAVELDKVFAEKGWIG